MPTPNLNLPTIDRNMSADVPRDMNALAYAVDDAVGPHGKIALKQDLQSLLQTLNNHINDNVKHVTKPERDGWNKAVVDIGDKNTLVTQNKGNLVLAINELFQSSSDKNTKIAAAITEKGVPTSPTATGDQMAANIRAIKTGINGEISLSPIPPNGILEVYTEWVDFRPMYFSSTLPGMSLYGGYSTPPMSTATNAFYILGLDLFEQPPPYGYRLRLIIKNAYAFTSTENKISYFMSK